MRKLVSGDSLLLLQYLLPMFIFLLVEAERCSQYLGMYDGSILDVQLSASSSRAGNRPSEARPHGVGWCSKSSDSEPYLQVSQILN